MFSMFIVYALLFLSSDLGSEPSGVSVKEEDQEDREETPIKEEPRDEILTPQDTSSESPSNESEKEIKREDEYWADEYNNRDLGTQQIRHNHRIRTDRDGEPSSSFGTGTGLERTRSSDIQQRRSYAF